MNAPDPDLAVVVLAAGMSRRFGGTQNKMLLSLQGQPLVRHTALVALDAGAGEVVVITGRDSADVVGALEGLPVRAVHNPRFADGLGTSVSAAIRAMQPGTQRALILLGDQPGIPGAAIRAVLEAQAHSGASIVRPMYRGVPGHPVLLARPVWPDLLDLSGDDGGRSLIRQTHKQVELVHLDQDNPPDIDTPQDWRALQGG